MANTIIGIAEMAVAHSPDSLTTLGLGSCVGIALYDRTKRLGGLSHILLPKAPENGNGFHRPKYADTALSELVERVTGAGANRSTITAKLAGGAQMFVSEAVGDVLQVGRRNVEMCREVLTKMRIAIIGEDTGGSSGRTIVFDCETGLLKVQTAWPVTNKTL